MAPIQPHPSNRCLQLVATITTATFLVAGVREIGAVSLTLGVCGLIKNDLPSPVYLKSCHQGVALFKEPADVAFLEEMCYQGRALRFSKAQAGPSGAVFSCCLGSRCSSLSCFSSTSDCVPPCSHHDENEYTS